MGKLGRYPFSVGHLLAGLLAAVLVAGIPAMAIADSEPDQTSTETDASAWDVFASGTLTYTQVSPEDGPGEPKVEPTSTLLSCTPDQCQVHGWENIYFAGSVILSSAQPSFAYSWPAQGDICDESNSGFALGAGSLQMEFSGGVLTVTESEEPIPNTECSDYTSSSIYGKTALLIFDTFEGDICALTGEPCETLPVPLTPLADPTDAADPANLAPLGSDATGMAASSSQLQLGDASAPSVLSALQTPAQAAQKTPMSWLIVAGLTLVLVILITFPTALMNRAVDAGSDRISLWWQRRRARDGSSAAADRVSVEAESTIDKFRWQHSWWWAALGVFIAAVISAFVDPEFGFNPGSVRVVLSIFIGFLLDIILGWVLVILLMRIFLPQARPSYSFNPASLLVVVLTVLFTRLTGFEPGIIFGLVAGVGFGAVIGKALAARQTLIPLGFAFVLSVVAWFVYGQVRDITGTSLPATFFVETLAGLTLAGTVVLPLALMPIRGLAGFVIFTWNRWVWAACYFVGLFAFFAIVMPMPNSWQNISWDLGAWVAIYVAYAAVALTLWLTIARPWRPAKASSEQPVREQANSDQASPVQVGSDQPD